MRKAASSVLSILSLLGIDVRTFLLFLRELPGFLRDYRELRRQRNGSPDFGLGRLTPVLGEKHAESGTASGAYFHQDLLVARKIFLARPKRHVDIGSRIDGFVAHVAAFREIEVFDIRAQRSKVGNITFVQCDMTLLPVEMKESCDSVSALHSIEHFGLGRYGDVVDYRGHLKAIDSIHSLLRSNGTFYFSVPIGPQRIEFNAHRVFDVSSLLDMLKERFRVVSFSFVDDKGDLTENARLDATSIQGNFGCHLGCGIFELERI